MENKKKGKMILGSAVVIALGFLGYAVYKKSTEESESEVSESSTTPETSMAVPVKKKSIFNFWADDKFPLKENSSGDRVKALQTALKKLSGNEALKVDGKFKTDTINALKRAKYPVVVDEKTFNLILNPPKAVIPVNTGEFNPQRISDALKKEVKAKNIKGVLSLLRLMQNPSDYQLVNEIYSDQPFWMPGTAYTIVTDLLWNGFPEITNPKTVAEKTQMANREAVVNEFRRIKLKWNKATKTFSLKGIEEEKRLITLAETLVADVNGNKFRVKPNTILGKEMFVTNGRTYFKGMDAKTYSVISKDVKFS